MSSERAIELHRERYMSLLADNTRLSEECDCHAKSANRWMEKAIAAERERDDTQSALKRSIEEENRLRAQVQKIECERDEARRALDEFGREIGMVISSWTINDGERLFWCGVHDKIATALRASTGEKETRDNRFDFLTNLVRQHRCNSDGAMTVAECIDSGRCGCCVGLVTRASTGEG